jgi:hypothetical protein
MLLRRIAERLQSRVLFLMDWHDYIDESYNSSTFCVGGFMATKTTWTSIERAWSERIGYENRRSAKKGHPPISRYHATDCANLKREFGEDRGWNIPRQIALSKRLCEIISKNGPTGIVIGGRVADVRNYLRVPKENARKALYELTFTMHLLTVAEVMRSHYPNDRVTVYWDRSKDFSPIARECFDRLMSDSGVSHLSRFFVTGSPLGWEDCVALQPADLMAFEGFKRISSGTTGRNDLRRSLRAMLGKQTEIVIGAYSEENFAELSRLGLVAADQRQKG